MSEIRVWKIVPLRMVTTSEQERDKWIAAGHEVVEFVSIDRIAQLEDGLAKVTARYNFVRDMTPEQFENTSTIHEDFDRQIDAAIKEQGE